MNRDDFFLLEGQCRPACVPACTYVRKALRRGVCICQRTKSVCACNVQVIKVAGALLVLYTEERLIWQKKNCKGSGGNKDTLIYTSCLTTIIKTGPEEEIWVKNCTKLCLLTDVCQNKTMRTDTSSNYTYPLITPLYLKGCHRCDQAKNLDIMEEKIKFFF